MIPKSLDPDFSIIKDDQKNRTAGDLSLIIRNLEQMSYAFKIKKNTRLELRLFLLENKLVGMACHADQHGFFFCFFFALIYFIKN